VGLLGGVDLGGAPPSAAADAILKFLQGPASAVELCNADRVCISTAGLQPRLALGEKRISYRGFKPRASS
jgi:hypothetical protein